MRSEESNTVFDSYVVRVVKTFTLNMYDVHVVDLAENTNCIRVVVPQEYVNTYSIRRGLSRSLRFTCMVNEVPSTGARANNTLRITRPPRRGACWAECVRSAPLGAPCTACHVPVSGRRCRYTCLPETLRIE